jgi:arylsulfatase
MAVYAAMVECMDRGVARIMDALRGNGIDEHTMVIFLSDNGGCQENVRADWYDIPNRLRDGREVHVGNNPQFMPGLQDAFQSYGPAWANVSNTPFRRFKHFTEEGGISTPFIVRWPGGVTKVGGILLDQVGSVIDLMPTILEAAGAKYPSEYRGQVIRKAEGMSLLSAIKGSATIARAEPLFWEHEGNRAVRLGDWKLVAAHGESQKLFNIASDRTELHDRSAEHPELVQQLREVYEGWAKRVGVEPWPVQN